MYKKIVDDIKEYDDNLLDRLWFQYYDVDMFYNLIDYYMPKNRILTLYRTSASWREIYNFCYNNEDVALAFNKRRASLGTIYINRLFNIGTPMFIHTINCEEEISKYLKMGVKKIFSDSVTENEFKNHFIN